MNKTTIISKTSQKSVKIINDMVERGVPEQFLFFQFKMSDIMFNKERKKCNNA